MFKAALVILIFAVIAVVLLAVRNPHPSLNIHKILPSQQGINLGFVDQIRDSTKGEFDKVYYNLKQSLYLQAQEGLKQVFNKIPGK